MGDAFGVIWLQAGEAQGGDPLGFLIPMGAIFLIFYFLLIRPQQRKQKDRDNMLKAVGKGDRVVTSGGIHGLVTGESEDVLTLEIANLRGERVRVKIDRGRIDRRIEKGKGEES
jgi:preprotein translocase subunit YajC